jgi:hypothetical protein
MRKRMKIQKPEEEKRSGWGVDIAGDKKTNYEAEKYRLETCCSTMNDKESYT